MRKHTQTFFYALTFPFSTSCVAFFPTYVAFLIILHFLLDYSELPYLLSYTSSSIILSCLPFTLRLPSLSYTLLSRSPCVVFFIILTFLLDYTELSSFHPALTLLIIYTSFSIILHCLPHLLYFPLYHTELSFLSSYTFPLDHPALASFHPTFPFSITLR